MGTHLQKKSGWSFWPGGHNIMHFGIGLHLHLTKFTLKPDSQVMLHFSCLKSGSHVHLSQFRTVPSAHQSWQVGCSWSIGIRGSQVHVSKFFLELVSQTMSHVQTQFILSKVKLGLHSRSHLASCIFSGYTIVQSFSGTIFIYSSCAKIPITHKVAIVPIVNDLSITLLLF